MLGNSCAQMRFRGGSHSGNAGSHLQRGTVFTERILISSVCNIRCAHAESLKFAGVL
jgi:hypothetical protein